ncbi:Calmodulin-like protein 5 [Entomortierella lignicola]|nr:Calmodulin-like protein 5 [Entomortierella lignicola]
MLPDHDLTEEQITELKESFNTFDRNGDGSINVSELRPLLKLVGRDYSKASVESAMAEFDTNKDQHIDFDEFLALVDKFMTNKV